MAADTDDSINGSQGGTSTNETKSPGLGTPEVPTIPLSSGAVVPSPEETPDPALKDPVALSLSTEAIVPSAEETPDPALKDPLVYCSGKIVFLHKLLLKLKRENSKSLIFSQFTTTLDILQEYLSDYGYAYERIDGGTYMFI
jgi:hypothetical protein